MSDQGYHDQKFYFVKSYYAGLLEEVSRAGGHSSKKESFRSRKHPGGRWKCNSGATTDAV